MNQPSKTAAHPFMYQKMDIATRQKLKLSWMPGNLPQAMSTQDLVDLVEYLLCLKQAR
jgi:hypothetical protein